MFTPPSGVTGPFAGTPLYKPLDTFRYLSSLTFSDNGLLEPLAGWNTGVDAGISIACFVCGCGRSLRPLS